MLDVLPFTHTYTHTYTLTHHTHTPHTRTHGEERLVKQAVRHIHGHRSEGDLLMDAPDVSWEQLLSVAADRDAWRRRVRALRMTPGTKWRNLVKRLLKNH